MPNRVVHDLDRRDAHEPQVQIVDRILDVRNAIPSLRRIALAQVTHH